MKPVNQSLTHDPDNGVWGDCHRACIASILELPIDAVPHFADGGADGDLMHSRTAKFLKTKNIGWASFAFIESRDVTIETVLQSQATLNPGFYYILAAQSTTGCGHSVVALDDKIVHNPNDSELVGGIPDVDDPSRKIIWVEMLIAGASLSE